MTNIPVWAREWNLFQHFMNAEVPFITRVTTNTFLPIVLCLFLLTGHTITKKRKENTKFAVWPLTYYHYATSVKSYFGSIFSPLITKIKRVTFSFCFERDYCVLSITKTLVHKVTVQWRQVKGSFNWNIPKCYFLKEM